MAIFHLSAHDRVSRSAGQSSLGSAAYIMRAKLTDERTGRSYDYRHYEGKPEWMALFSPKDAPDWTRDAANAERFWNALELFEKRKDAQIALPFDIALPHEMTRQQQIWLAQDFVRENFTRPGYVCLAAIHPPDHDERNYHLHLLVSLRKIGKDGFARTKTEQQENYKNRDAYIENLRDKWEQLTNRHLARHGIDARIDRRSLREQGIDRAPQRHRGPTQSAAVFAMQDRERRAKLETGIKNLQAQVIGLDARRAERVAAAGGGPRNDAAEKNYSKRQDDEITAEKATTMQTPDMEPGHEGTNQPTGEKSHSRDGAANQNSRELGELEQREREGVPFTPAEPQPGRYDQLKAEAPPSPGEISRAEAWQQPEMSIEGINADPLTAVYKPIPEQADEFLLCMAAEAAFRRYNDLGRALQEEHRQNPDDVSLDAERGIEHQRDQAAARLQEIGLKINTVLLSYDPADEFRDELIAASDRAEIVRAWEKPAFTSTTIAADAWTAVYLPIPTDAGAGLLNEARMWAEGLQGYAENPRSAFAVPLITLPFATPDHRAAATDRLNELDARLEILAEMPRPEIVSEARTTPEPETAPTAREETIIATGGQQRPATGENFSDLESLRAAELEASAGTFFDRAGRIGQQVLAAIGDRIGAAISYAAEFFAPAPKMTPQQVHDTLQAHVGNLEKDHAQAVDAGRRETDAVREWQQLDLTSAQQEKDLRLAQALGTNPTAESNLNRDEHDRQREHDRERDYGRDL